MANRYCDHGLYGTPVAGGTVPSASEDGNGAAKTAAAMATLVVTFTGVPAATGAITIAGITFTAVASGATGNQFNAVTDATTCALNLRNAINASTTNALKPTGVIAATAPLRNVVNATVSAGVLTVYTRCSGSEWNSVVETSTLTNASITSQWSGGSDGAWGYFFNTASLAFPTSLGAHTYGLWGSTTRPYVGSLPVAGSGFGLIVMRSGKSITAATNVQIGADNFQPFGVSAAIIVDDGTEWPADGSTPTFNITWTIGSSNYGFIAPIRSALLAKKYASTYGFNLTMVASGANSVAVFAGKARDFSGFNVSCPAGVTVTNKSSSDSPLETEMSHFRECKFVNSGGSAAFFWFDATYQVNTMSVNFSECVFSNIGNAAAHPGLIPTCSGGRRYSLYFDSCIFEDFQPASRLFISASDTRGPFQAYFRNCDLRNVSIIGPNPLWANSVSRVMAGSTQFGNRDFFIDNMFGFVEWNSYKSFPTLNAKLLDGVTGWSMRLIPSTTSGNNNRFQFCETPRIAKINSLAAGVRTLTVELAIHDSQTWDLSKVSAVIDYMDTSGNRQVIDTYDYEAGALTASTSTWSSESSGKVSFVDGTTQLHNKYKFSVVTPTAIETDTEIGVVVRCHTTVDSTVKGMFIDPEIQVT